VAEAAQHADRAREAAAMLANETLR
jgi:hypothetical protein